MHKHGWESQKQLSEKSHRRIHTAQYHVHNSSETGKAKQHVRDTDIDGESINKNMGIINKKSRVVYPMWCVRRENKWRVLGI